MVVESISCPMPTICDQAVAQTYNPGIEVRFKKQQQQKKKQKKKNKQNKKKKQKKKTDAIPKVLFYRSTAQWRYALYKLRVNSKYIFYIT